MTYENNSVTFLPNGAWTPSLLMQQMDKSPPDPGSGGLTPIGNMLVTNLPDQHLSHYIGHPKTDTTDYTIPSPRRSNRPYMWKTGRLLQSFATNNYSIASPHKLPLTWDDHHPMHKPTKLHGKDGNKTTDNSHRGNINHSFSLAHTKATGNPSPHYNQSDSWHYQTTTPRLPTNTHQLAPCWETPGIFHQRFGYSHYYWWFLPTQHSKTLLHNPTYKDSLDCGCHPKYLGDHQLKQHSINTCHNSIGTATSGGPAHCKTRQQIIATLILAYAGPSTNLSACPTYNRSGSQS